MDFIRIFLNSKEEREILQGFPWVYDNEISHVKYRKTERDEWKVSPLGEAEIENGSGVEVFTKAGGFLGTGIVNKASKIAVRIISHEHADKVFEDIAKLWEQRIFDAYNIRKISFGEKESYRLIFSESDFIPGLIVDRFCDVSGKVYLVVQFLALASDIYKNEIVAALKKVCSPYAMYERDDAEVRLKEGLEEKSGWIGKEGNTEITIEENGVLLNIDIANGQKTGYFLDQKDNRAAAAKFCHGKKVFDAFCHTGAFGLNAAKAGAREVICADISQDAVNLTKSNIAKNNARDVVKAVCGDVFELLKFYEEKGEKFDVIILDPPAFTKSAKMIKKAYGGYKEINLRAMRILRKGGILITCSCSQFFDSQVFYEMLTHAAKDSHRKVQILEKRGASFDHPVLLGHPKSEYLKCAICHVI